MGDVPGIEVGAVPLDQLLAHPLGGIGRRQVDLRAELRRGDRSFLRLAVLGSGNGTLREHPAQHQIAALERPLGAVDGVAALGLLHDAGEHGELCQIEVLDRLAVVGVGGRLHAVGALAERHDVHVELQYLGLGQLLLDLQG